MAHNVYGVSEPEGWRGPCNARAVTAKGWVKGRISGPQPETLQFADVGPRAVDRHSSRSRTRPPKAAGRPPTWRGRAGLNLIPTFSGGLTCAGTDFGERAASAVPFAGWGGGFPVRRSVRGAFVTQSTRSPRRIEFPSRPPDNRLFAVEPFLKCARRPPGRSFGKFAAEERAGMRIVVPWAGYGVVGSTV